MKNNEDLQKDIQDAIKWEPLLNGVEIGVTAKDGIITLTGIVESYDKKLEVEDVAKNVAGVKAVVEEIKIHSGADAMKDDHEIANDVLNAFQRNMEFPIDKVKVKVEDGWVTLEGDLKWNFQKESAKKIVSKIVGVRGITNHIAINSETHDAIEKKDIERALGFNWAINEKEIQIEVSGNNVILNGTVHSWYQKNQAERIAWNAPGVCNVENKLVIESN